MRIVEAGLWAVFVGVCLGALYLALSVNQDTFVQALVYQGF